MDNSFESILDRDVSHLVEAISECYEEGTLLFLEADFPSFRAQLDRAEERLGRLRHDLLAGSETLAEWRAALEELRGLWELAGQVLREHADREAIDAADEIQLVGAEA